MCLGAFLACVSVHTVYVWDPQSHPETGVADNCEWPHDCQEPTPGSLEKQPALLAVSQTLRLSLPRESRSPCRGSGLHPESPPGVC